MLFRINPHRKTVSFLLIFIFLFQVLLPTTTLALTSGPADPSITNSAPAGYDNMVDLFSGQLNYSIPLFDLPGPDGGYPFVLNYNSDVKMETEASWVGLGWSLNTGAINRSMRGVPDDFKGDHIKYTKRMKKNWTVGLTATADAEAFGGAISEFASDISGGDSSAVNLNLDFSYNNYNGFDVSAGVDLGFHKAGETGVDLGIDVSPSSGLSISPSYSIMDIKDKNWLDLRMGLSLNSKYGISTLGLGIFNFDLNPNTYTPIYKDIQNTLGFSFKYKFGTDILGGKGSVSTKGSYFEQNLDVDEFKGAYGYNFSQEANELSVTDINRQRSGTLSKHNQNLDIPNFTHDVYNLSSATINGTFRSYRNDVGTLSDPYVDNTSANGINVGIDATPPNGIGIDISTNISYIKSGPWDEDNSFSSTFPFLDFQQGQKQEPFHFKFLNEKSIDDINVLDQIGGTDPMQIGVSGGLALSSLLYDSGNNATITNTQNSLRKSRSNNIQSFTNAQLRKPNSTNIVLPEFVYRHDSGDDIRYEQRALYKDHHIGGFQVTDQNGSRQIYGLPVYNISHVEQQFSITKDLTLPYITNYPLNPTTNLPDETNSGDSDEYFNRTEMDPYPYTYLLTCVLGADYVDADNIRGPSDGDKGYWVKFNYEQESEVYNWRSPFEGAFYSAGHYCDLPVEDDKASYTYGERRSFVLTSAETKSHRAYFHVSEREDARGAYEENNFINPLRLGAALKRLDKIELYSKRDFDAPLKTVHFGYSYDLCQGIPNSVTNGGKLTLDSLGFTYRNNTRGVDNPYVFDYNQDVIRHSYNPINKDAWGDFKFMGTVQEQVEFPFVVQPENLSPSAIKKQDISAWKLKSITTPTSGILDIKYEPTDYAKVQDRKASQSFKIYSLERSFQPVLSSQNTQVYSTLFNNRYIYFKLDKSYPVDDKNLFIQEYLSDLNKDHRRKKQIHFKAFTNLGAPTADLYDFVSGYAPLEYDGVYPICGLAKSSSSLTEFDLGYIKVDKPRIGDRVMQYHPIAFAGFQVRRKELARLPVFPSANTLSTNNVTSSSILNIANNIVTRIPSLISFFKNYYVKCRGKNWSKNINLDYSYISLNTPDNTKYGGGARVKSIIQNDNWNALTGESNSEYGLVYDYYDRDSNGDIISSSGVAANEPPLLKIENNLHSIKYHPNKSFLHTVNRGSFEYPINEAYYPGPSIGHSKVTVQSLATEQGNSSTGYSTHEFYTYNDFPCYAQETEIIKGYQEKIVIPIPLIGNITRSPLTVSQGYSMHNNDMHGKQKQVSHYMNYSNCVLEENPSSYIKHNYQSEYKIIRDIAKNENKVIQVLNNETDVLLDNHINGNYVNAKKQKKLIGVDFEIFADLNASRNHSEQYGIHANLDVTVAPFPIPSPWPTVITNTSKVRTAVVNKIIERKGILSSVEALDDNSYVKTENLAYDQYTGQPIFTKLNDNYDQSRYQYAIPGHWDYKGMQAAFLTEGLQFQAEPTARLPQYGEYVVQFNLGPSTSTQVANALFNGDEVICSEGLEKHKGYIVSACPGTIEVYFPSQYAPDTINTVSHNFFISRSGRRNLIQASTSNYLTKEDPTINRAIDSECIVVRQSCTDCDECPSPEAYALKIPLLDKVISLSANSYTDDNLPVFSDPYYFQCRDCCIPKDSSIFTNNEVSNPWLPSRFHTGSKGIWRPHKSFTYLSNRDYGTLEVGQPLTQLDQQGFMNNTPMFRMDEVEEFLRCRPDWKLTSEITKYDEYSNPIEEKDIYDLYSSATYQFKGMVQNAIAYNASQKDFYHLDFEDEDQLPYSYTAPVFGHPHTGKGALTVDDNFTFTIPIDNFEPQEGNEYWLSCWMKSDVPIEFSKYLGAGQSLVQLKFIGPNSFKQIRTVGPKIEGYQKIEGSFIVPPGTTEIEYTFMPHNPVQATSSDPYTSFDDFRIHPMDANMNTFVYDNSYKLVAKLDQNNVATGYIYDEKEKYVSTKVEVESGQKTVQSISSFNAQN